MWEFLKRFLGYPRTANVKPEPVAPYKVEVSDDRDAKLDAFELNNGDLDAPDDLAERAMKENKDAAAAVAPVIAEVAKKKAAVKAPKAPKADAPKKPRKSKAKPTV